MTAIAACRRCGTEPLENARFCHSCGSPVDQFDTRAEYKQVTVIFADVAHSMDLAAQVGEERLRDIMAGLVDRDLRIARPHGRDDDHRRRGDVRLRRNRPGPNRTQRGLEIDDTRESRKSVAIPA